LPTCPRCLRPVGPDDLWDLGMTTWTPASSGPSIAPATAQLRTS
jgi:hypothetical protein